jgi:predicted hydrocarbon binding protein
MNNSHVDIYLCECPSHPLFCQRMEGFFTGIIIAVCKVEGGEVEQVKCSSSGDRYCKFEARWEPM